MATSRRAGHNFPYEDDVKEIIEQLRPYQTRVRPENTVKVQEFDLDYGWKASLYQREQGLKEKFFDKIRQVRAQNLNYVRTPPEYEWELEAPNGETVHRLGIDLEPKNFEEKITELLEKGKIKD